MASGGAYAPGHWAAGATADDRLSADSGTALRRAGLVDLSRPPDLGPRDQKLGFADAYLGCLLGRRKH